MNTNRLAKKRMKNAILIKAAVFILILSFSAYADDVTYYDVGDVFHNFTTAYSPEVYTNSSNIIIGTKGTIDDVLIFNRSLSAAEIKALYENKTNTIVSDETRLRETWYADITSNDGTQDSAKSTSQNISIDGIVTYYPYDDLYSTSDYIDFTFEAYSAGSTLTNCSVVSSNVYSAYTTAIDEYGLNRIQANVFNHLTSTLNNLRLACKNAFDYYLFSPYINVSINHYPRYMDNIQDANISFNYRTANNGLQSNNVTDVYLYDCSRDGSCNAAWRTNSSKSWYIEKGKFPDKALLAATGKGLDIIDTDIDEIWMRFTIAGTTSSDSSMIGPSSPKHVKAVDGKIYLDYDGDYGLRVIDFTSDNAYYYYTDQAHTFKNSASAAGNISIRNQANGFATGLVSKNALLQGANAFAFDVSGSIAVVGTNLNLNFWNLSSDGTVINCIDAGTGRCTNAVDVMVSGGKGVWFDGSYLMRIDYPSVNFHVF